MEEEREKVESWKLKRAKNDENCLVSLSAEGGGGDGVSSSEQVGITLLLSTGKRLPVLRSVSSSSRLQGRNAKFFRFSASRGVRRAMM
jgi:hypothetical protein